MKAKADRDEASPYAALLATQDVVEKCKLLRATGGNRTKTPGPGAQLVIRALAYGPGVGLTSRLKCPLKRRRGVPSLIEFARIVHTTGAGNPPLTMSQIVARDHSHWGYNSSIL
ncbi:conserved hypothetical protein [Culex quinquefasciatus]|uniref:40S ribosomal protein S14 n=1 Tax=Culex quinquefasciatus TaxID=7176 RepID=B0WJ79_CULQU|nr:conserved hypothetical protein [Culex quinquefasciatus]|eukprot:XP_001848763.1 conserved hypothetical protein [Culex quinquefasciatus]